MPTPVRLKALKAQPGQPAYTREKWDQEGEIAEE